MFHRTERLFLRPAFPEDWKAVLHSIASDTILRNLASAPMPYTAEEARRFVARPQDPWVPHFLVTLPDEGPIGSVALSYDEATNLVQLGYWIAQDHWGKGYASEAARSVVAIARAIGHRRITASHFVDNPASGRVLRKIGFRPTGAIQPGYSLARGGYDPVVRYEVSLAQCDSETTGHVPAMIAA